MERHRDVACFKIRITTVGKVKYAPIKLKGTTKHQIMAMKAGSGALQNEIP